MMKQTGSTRDAIIYKLRSQGRMQISVIAHELGLTEMAIRRHMHELSKQGYVEIISIKQAMGRPLHAYELTLKAEELFPRNYQLLTVDLLRELEDDPDTQPIIDRMFQGRKRKLSQRYAASMKHKDLADRVEVLANIQRAGGYMAETKQDEQYYYIEEYNCPIKSVADHYYQACQCELELFQELLDAPVERVECLSKGGMKCNYRILKQTKA